MSSKMTLCSAAGEELWSGTAEELVDVFVRLQEQGALNKLEDEKQRRIYYQDIVYKVCNLLDAHHGRSITRGEGVVCGTAGSPSKDVEQQVSAALVTSRERRKEIAAMSGKHSEQFQDADRIENLVAALREIAEHPRRVKNNPRNDHECGRANGHRACAEIAQAALKGQPKRDPLEFGGVTKGTLAFCVTDARRELVITEPGRYEVWIPTGECPVVVLNKLEEQRDPKQEAEPQQIMEGDTK